MGARLMCRHRGGGTGIEWEGDGSSPGAAVAVGREADEAGQLLQGACPEEDCCANAA